MAVNQFGVDQTQYQQPTWMGIPYINQNIVSGENSTLNELAHFGDKGWLNQVLGDRPKAAQYNEAGEQTSEGQGWFGKEGGFGSKLGTGRSPLRGLGRIGSAQFGENQFILDEEGNPTEKLDPRFGEEISAGRGIFGKEGGFMSHFGTGEGKLAGLFGGLGGGEGLMSGLGAGFSSAGQNLMMGGYQHPLMGQDNY